MQIEHIVDKKTKNDLKQLCNSSTKAKKPKEQLSKRDLADLMGTNRDRYRRVNGAWRSK